MCLILHLLIFATITSQVVYPNLGKCSSYYILLLVLILNQMYLM